MRETVGVLEAPGRAAESRDVDFPAARVRSGESGQFARE